MNIAIISGRLTDAPRITYTVEGKAIARYCVAADYSRNESSFIYCTAYDEKAQFAEKYFRKGSRVEVAGKIKTGNYTDRDGRKVYYTEITVNVQSFGESKAEAESRQQQAADGNGTAGDGFTDIPNGLDDEMPFA